MQGDLDSLFELNRSRLKKVFAKHFPSKEGKMSYAEFCKFCKNARIHPDLMSMLELKRTVVRLTSIAQTNKVQLSYAQFEHVLKHIAVATFNSTIPLDEKLRMLILHMKNPIKQEYQVSLHCNSGEPASHSSDLEESQEVPRETLRVTLDLSKTPRLQKPLNFSPSLSTPKLDSPKVSPRAKVPLLHVTLDKQKPRQPRNTQLVDKAHIRTASAGTHAVQSPRFGTESKPVEVLRDSPTQDLRRALTSLQSALPPSRPHLDVLQAERQQGFIRATTASWFTRDFVLRMMLKAWRDYAHRRHAARLKSAAA